MKTIKFLITLCVFLSAFYFGGIALADDSGVLASVTSDSTLEAPKLTITIDGTKVTLSWNKVSDATGYVVHYAQKPYDNPDTIKTIDVGNKTSASYDLSPGDAYHVAVKAYKDSGSDCSDYSIIHDVVIPLVSTFKNSLGQTFKLIPAGTFKMGSPSDELGRYDDETQHHVTLTKPFYMQTTEVTQAQWETVMGSNPSSNQGCSTCPVETVSWDDVQSYITKMNHRGEGTYRLPTEAQWEYAARAGSTTPFYNGGIASYPDMEVCNFDANLNAIAWYCYNAGEHGPSPVAGKTPNHWGLFDMSGNVGEWCQDFYGRYYYTSNPATDPTGPSYGTQRVMRGGPCMWNLAARDYRSAARWFDSTDPRIGRSVEIGFRLLRLP